MKREFAFGSFSQTLTPAELAGRLSARGGKAQLLRDGVFLCAGDIAAAKAFEKTFADRLIWRGFIVIRTDLTDVDKRRSAGKELLKKLADMLRMLTAFWTPAEAIRPEEENDRMPSLAECFTTLGDLSRADVVLVIVGADRLKDRGADLGVMKNLKAARDAVNIGGNRLADTALYVVGIGTNEERLRAMIGRPSEPFFGAEGFRAAV